MATDAKQATAGTSDEQVAQDSRECTSCGLKLSSYNPGPNCWQHTIGNPWRGPSAKPRYD